MSEGSDEGPSGPPGEAPDGSRDAVARVSQLELFFDLVFVFTITQLTSLLTDRLTWGSVWHVAIMFGLIFWMYDGYAWLTNAVPAEGARRQVILLGGMGGYLVLAVAIPNAFSGTAVTFGIAWLVITAIHAGLYVTFAAESSSSAMRSLAPWNLGAAVAVLAAGIVGGRVQEYVWTAVVLVLWFATRVSSDFEIGPSHFVERHELLVLVALGESVVAAGIGARHLPVDLTLVVAVLLGLVLSAELWWTYFGQGDEAVERAFRQATGADRVRVAFVGFGYAHGLMLIGVIFAAVGLRLVVADPGAELHAGAALVLTGGAALFLAGDGWFRVELGLRPGWRRQAGALAVLVAAPIAVGVSALAGLAATTALVGAVVASERRPLPAPLRRSPQRRAPSP